MTIVAAINNFAEMAVKTRGGCVDPGDDRCFNALSRQRLWAKLEKSAYLLHTHIGKE